MPPRPKNSDQTDVEAGPDAGSGATTPAEGKPQVPLAADVAPTRRRLLRALAGGSVALATLATLAACGGEDDEEDEEDED